MQPVTKDKLQAIKVIQLWLQHGTTSIACFLWIDGNIVWRSLLCAKLGDGLEAHGCIAVGWGAEQAEVL